MSGRKRRRFDARTKARVALEAIRERKTSAQIASEHSCHSTQITKWKRQALDGLPGIFDVNRSGILLLPIEGEGTAQGE